MNAVHVLSVGVTPVVRVSRLGRTTFHVGGGIGLVTAALSPKHPPLMSFRFALNGAGFLAIIGAIVGLGLAVPWLKPIAMVVSGSMTRQ